MKNLLLIRHAKATHDTGYIDFERPLKPSGAEDAGIMADRLKKNGIIPQMMIASPALRTISTANIIAEHLGLPAPVTNQRIYEGSSDTLLDIIREVSDEYGFVALVGHNPNISGLLYRLTHESQDMQTCACALISLEADKWSDIKPATGLVAFYSYPGEE